MTARHTSDLDQCYECERTLAPHEEVYCASCQSKVLAAWDPTDADLARRDAMLERGWRELAALIFPLVVLLTAGASMLASNAHAQDTRTVTRTINDRPYTWTLPAAGCSLLRAWEDNSALAWCPDGMNRYDPEDATWYTVTATR